MALFDVTQTVLEQALVGASVRQRAISNNIANANTPGFKRSDLDFAAMLRGAIQTDDPEAQVKAIAFTPQTDGATTARADGNNVDIDVEMANLYESSSMYQAIASVMKSRIRMLETVLGGGR